MTSAKYHARRDLQTRPFPFSVQRMMLLAIILCLLAGAVRWFMWQDNRWEVRRVETFVTSDYKDSAHQLLTGNLRTFFNDVNHLEHPPGYAILLAAIFKVFGESDKAIQFMQIVADCAAAVVVALIAGELFSAGIATLAGALIALSPQLGYYSLLLLPDSICILPILLAVYFLVRAVKRPQVLSFVIGGALIGVSCWLRANALLLAPFAACFLPLLLKKGGRLRPAAVLILGAMIVIAPITIKNAVVFHRFVPLSLGAGQKLLQGIAEYDSGAFGVPQTDLGIMRQEAVVYDRPDYALLLFGPDGIQRDRQRVRRGLSIIAAHPVWYSGVMSRRAGSFFRFARVPVIARDVPVSNILEAHAKPGWTAAPNELLLGGSISPRSATVITEGSVRLRTDETKYGMQVESHPIAVIPHHDYLLRLPIKLEDGRIVLKITDLESRVLISTNVDLVEGVPGPEQPSNDIALPLVSGVNSQVRFRVENNAPANGHSVVEIGPAQLFDLGSSTGEWKSFIRLPLRWFQSGFITAVIIPIVLLGLGVLIWQRQFRSVLLMLLVPFYYAIFQSPLHTERRYVAAIQYFLLIFAAVGLANGFLLIKQFMHRRPSRPASVRSTH